MMASVPGRDLAGSETALNASQAMFEALRHDTTCLTYSIHPGDGGGAVAQGKGARITARVDVVVGMRSIHAARGSRPGQNPTDPWARDAPGDQDPCSASE